MLGKILDMLSFGLVPLPWWGYLIVLLTCTQVTVLAVTIYLHRCQAHRALVLHPIMSHFFRFWLWLTTGIETKQWTAVHRKHHAKVETDEDPQSPIASSQKTTKRWNVMARARRRIGSNAASTPPTASLALSH